MCREPLTGAARLGALVTLDIDWNGAGLNFSTAMKELFAEFGHGSLARLPVHRNPGLEVVYLRHGHLLWQCEGRPEALSPGSLYFTLPWQEHGSVTEFERGHEWFFVVIRLRDAPLDRPGPFRFPPMLGIAASTSREICRRLMQSRRHAWPAPPLADQLLPALVEELARPGPFHRQRVVHLTSALILELAQTLGRSQRGSQQVRNDDRFSALLGELERDCGEPWTLSKMAERLRLHRTQFTKLFHHYTGDSPLRCLQRMRVARACRLLRTTRHSITDVALDCGFYSGQHLANVFRSFTGITPSHYRNLGPLDLKLPRPQQWG